MRQIPKKRLRNIMQSKSLMRDVIDGEWMERDQNRGRETGWWI